jgi:hypothetical protein
LWTPGGFYLSGGPLDLYLSCGFLEVYEVYLRDGFFEVHLSGESFEVFLSGACLIAQLERRTSWVVDPLEPYLSGAALEPY